MTAGEPAGEVVVERRIRAPARVVYEMFTDAALLVQWIGIAATLEPRPGGVFRFALFEGEYCSGRFVELVPYSRLVFTWGWESGKLPVAPGASTVVVELAERDGETLVRLTHRGLDDAMQALHRDGWQRYLDRLRDVLEGRAPAPDPAAPYHDGSRGPLDD